jgi:Ca2+-binding EF-hand superfamily protein
MIDREEMSEAIADPAFVEFALPTIDANHNGWLDPEEFAFFDINRDGILQPREQAGIDIAERLLAERVLAEFDYNGDGQLDAPELSDALQAQPVAISSMLLNFPPLDRDHNGKVSLEELKTFWDRQTLAMLRGELRLRTSKAHLHPEWRGKEMSLKDFLEGYWQITAGRTNGTPHPANRPLGQPQRGP